MPRTDLEAEEEALIADRFQHGAAEVAAAEYRYSAAGVAARSWWQGSTNLSVFIMITLITTNHALITTEDAK
jgi:hypothetical protein